MKNFSPSTGAGLILNNQQKQPTSSISPHITTARTHIQRDRQKTPTPTHMQTHGCECTRKHNIHTYKQTHTHECTCKHNTHTHTHINTHTHGKNLPLTSINLTHCTASGSRLLAAQCRGVFPSMSGIPMLES